MPWAAVAVVAVYLSRTTTQILAAAIALVLPWFVIDSLHSLVTGRPIGHDVWVGDPLYWLGVGTHLLLAVIAIGFLSLAFRWGAKVGSGA